MLPNIIEIFKEILQYGLQFLAITGVLFLIFLLFTKYRTEHTFADLWKSYVQLFVHACIFSITLLSIIVILTKYISICALAVMLLAISSVSILLKYIDLFKEGKGLLVDVSLLLANSYVMYSLATHDPVSIHHYLVLYAIVLYVFLYQRLKSVYKEV